MIWDKYGYLTGVPWQATQARRIQYPSHRFGPGAASPPSPCRPSLPLTFLSFLLKFIGSGHTIAPIALHWHAPGAARPTCAGCQHQTGESLIQPLFDYCLTTV
jgi:hypothetical protein